MTGTTIKPEASAIIKSLAIQAQSAKTQADKEKAAAAVILIAQLCQL